MEDGWVLVFETDQMYISQIAKQRLSDAGIHPVIINKKDNTLPIGEIEIYVKTEDYNQAKELIKQL